MVSGASIWKSGVKSTVQLPGAKAEVTTTRFSPLFPNETVTVQSFVPKRDCWWSGARFQFVSDYADSLILDLSTLDEAQAYAASLPKHIPVAQALRLVLVMCYVPRLAHLPQTVPLSMTLLTAARYDDAVMAAACRLLKLPPDVFPAVGTLDYQLLKHQIFFPLRYGRWGLTSGALTRHAAYLGAWVGALPLIRRVLKRLVVMPADDGLGAAPLGYLEGAAANALSLFFLMKMPRAR